MSKDETNETPNKRIVSCIIIHLSVKMNKKILRTKFVVDSFRLFLFWVYCNLLVIYPTVYYFKSLIISFNSLFLFVGKRPIIKSRKTNDITIAKTIRKKFTITIV